MSDAEAKFTLTRSALTRAIKAACESLAEPIAECERKQFEADAAQLARVILAQLGVR